jgi:hypothetical protein
MRENGRWIVNTAEEMRCRTLARVTKKFRNLRRFWAGDRDRALAGWAKL